jgi:hypothetical protein
MASLVTTTVNGNLTIAGNSASDSHNVVFSDTGGEEWYVEYNGGLRFVESGAAQRFIIADGGNATLQQNLTINTRLTFSGGSSQYLEIATNSIALKNSSGTVLWNSSNQVPASGGTFTGDITISKSVPKFTLVNTSASSKTWDILGNGSSFYITEASVADRLLIQAGGNVTFTSNVFRVQSASSTDMLVRINSGSSEVDSRLMIGEGDNYGMTLEYDGLANIGYLGMNDNVAPTGAWSKRIQMSRGGTEVAFMAGLVGIGTNNPSTEGLEIMKPSADTTFNLNDQSDSMLVLRNSDSASTNTGRFCAIQMKINSNSAAAEGTIRTQFAGDGDADLIFSTTKGGTGYDRMFLDEDGFVGIGTNGPETRLHVEGSTYSESSIKMERSGSGINEDAGLIFSKSSAATDGHRLGGVYFGHSGTNYALIRAEMDASTGGEVYIVAADQTNAISNTSTKTLQITAAETTINGTFKPRVDSTYTLGTNANRWSHLYVDAITAGGAVTVGVDDTGYDVRLYGATSGRYWEWDASMDLVRMRDNVKAVFGNGDDLEIYHDGSNSYITDSGTGDLIIAGSDDLILKATGSNELIRCNANSNVQLFHNGTEKLVTQTTGVQITGGTDIDPSSGAAGQFKVTGNGYTTFLAMNGTAAYFGHNSSSRSLVLMTNETARLTITGGGAATFSSSVAASSFSGNGASLTSLNASNLSSGTVPAARLGNVTIASSATDILSASSGSISADDAGADKIVFWDDSASKLTYLTVGSNLSISGTTISASGGGGGGSGTVTEVTVGTGLDVSSGTTTPNITLDFNELATAGTVSGSDDFVVVDGTSTRKEQMSSISLSGFSGYYGLLSSIYKNNGTGDSITPDSSGYMYFYEGTGIGLSFSGNSITFSSSTGSDYRLKKNISTFNSEAWTKVKGVNLRKFDFDEDAFKTAIASPDREITEEPKNYTDNIGFIAHELAEAGIQGSVIGDKDAVDEDGNFIYQKVNYIALVPLLWGALKEAISKIETLESKVQALEDK